jgi:dTDP-glucose 4,6-dehydratase
VTLAAALAGRSIAVVGGSGLIGTNLLRAIRALRADATPVWCVSRTLPPLDRRVEGVDYLAASALDAGGLAGLPAADLAVYVAGATSNYLDDPLLTVRLSTEGLSNVLRHFAGAARRLVVGSSRIYGPRSDGAPLTERDPCIAPSPSARNVYDGAKLVAEALALGASSDAHPVVSTRLGNVYGPHASPATATAFTDLLRQARHGRRIVLKGPPASLRNHLHAADAADGILRALAFGRGGESYNLGSDDHLTNVEFARAIAGSLPFAVEVEASNPAPPDHLVLSSDKARRELSYSPTHRAAEHIPETVRWELEHSR